ncbi:MAG: N-acetyltransferase [Burkholderiales bacterium]|nr:MAG: N-acetyltransferase [Burkholderiales bacterium]
MYWHPHHEHDPSSSTASVPRHRWDGPLSGEQLARLRAAGLPLAYDPAQNGWVVSQVPDADDDPDLPIWAGLSRLQLRPWRESDLDRFHALLDDPELWRYMTEDMPTPFTRSVAADLIAISSAGRHHEVQAIQTSQGPVGQVRMLWTGPGLQPDEAEISYWLGRSHRGRGWASEAVRQAASAALRSRAGLARVVAYVHPQNTASTRVLARAGFVPAAARASDGWLGFALNRPKN